MSVTQGTGPTIGWCIICLSEESPNANYQQVGNDKKRVKHMNQKPKKMPTRKRCQICRHRPGRRIECVTCKRKVGPCCFRVSKNRCILCARNDFEPEPEPKGRVPSYESIKVVMSKTVAINWLFWIITMTVIGAATGEEFTASNVSLGNYLDTIKNHDAVIGVNASDHDTNSTTLVLTENIDVKAHIVGFSLAAFVTILVILVATIYLICCEGWRITFAQVHNEVPDQAQEEERIEYLDAAVQTEMKLQILSRGIHRLAQSPMYYDRHCGGWRWDNETWLRYERWDSALDKWVYDEMDEHFFPQGSEWSTAAWLEGAHLARETARREAAERDAAAAAEEHANLAQAAAAASSSASSRIEQEFEPSAPMTQEERDLFNIDENGNTTTSQPHLRQAAAAAAPAATPKARPKAKDLGRCPTDTGPINWYGSKVSGPEMAAAARQERAAKAAGAAPTKWNYYVLCGPDAKELVKDIYTTKYGECWHSTPGCCTLANTTNPTRHTASFDCSVIRSRRPCQRCVYQSDD